MHMLYLFKNHVRYPIYITAATSQPNRSFDRMKHYYTNVMRVIVLQEETLEK